MRALGAKTLREIRYFIAFHQESDPSAPRLLAALDQLLKPSLKAKAARSARAAEKKTKKAAHNSETSEIRRKVFERAGGLCEGTSVCGFAPTVMDHFFGKAKVRQAVANCWALCRQCDHAKTNNKPSAALWFERFIRHAKKHGYHAEASRAERDHRSGQ